MEFLGSARSSAVLYDDKPGEHSKISVVSETVAALAATPKHEEKLFAPGFLVSYS